jgi:alpha-1,3/alpha-1,6-mannosyltransferase
LRDAGRAEEWSEVMGRVLNDLGEGEWERMGRAGVERVKGRFAEAQMAERLEGILGGMERTSSGLGVSVLVAGVVAVVGVLLGVGVLAVRIAR